MNKRIILICRSAQFINVLLGGHISKVEGHVRKPHLIKNIHDSNEFTVNTFHNYAIKAQDLSQELEALFLSQDNLVEVYKHRSNNVVGIQWHPERSDNSPEALNYFREICNG